MTKHNYSIMTHSIVLLHISWSNGIQLQLSGFKSKLYFTVYLLCIYV